MDCVSKRTFHSLLGDSSTQRKGQSKIQAKL